MHRTPYLVGVVVLSLSVLAIGWASYASLIQRDLRSPLERYAPCSQITGGPSKLYACSNRRAYIEQDGRWQDAGPLSTSPVVPVA
jgi:hypothetical protein